MGKLRTHKGFASGERDASAAAIVKGFVAQDSRHNVGHLFFLAADRQRLGRAAVGEGVEMAFVEFFAMDDQSVQRTVDNSRNRLLAQVAAFEAQTRIKQHIPRAGAAFRVLAPAAAERAALQEHHGTNTWAVVGGVTLNIEDHIFAPCCV
ncbi:hypothetical protein D3C76_983610 [compost metagenome]